MFRSDVCLAFHLIKVPSPYASSSSLQSNYSSSGGTSYSSFQSAPVAPSSAHTYDRPQVSSYQTVSSFDMMEIFHDEYTEKINIQEGRSLFATACFCSLFVLLYHTLSMFSHTLPHALITPAYHLKTCNHRSSLFGKVIVAHLSLSS